MMLCCCHFRDCCIAFSLDAAAVCRFTCDENSVVDSSLINDRDDSQMNGRSTCYFVISQESFNIPNLELAISAAVRINRVQVLSAKVERSGSLCGVGNYA